LTGRRKASPAAPFGRGPHPAQEAGFYLKFGFNFILIFHNAEIFQKL
jgi:hypothetical protein